MNIRRKVFALACSESGANGSVRRKGLLVLLALVLALPCLAKQVAIDEKGLWTIWQSQTNAPDEHATLVDACKEFATKSPKDPLLTVTQGLQAWHLLKAGNTNEAKKIFESMVVSTDDSLKKAGSDMACGWLSRLDRELVKVALTKYYHKDIEFPLGLSSLKQVKKMPPFPPTDRWEQSWAYQVENKGGLSRQGYSLQSKHLGTNSDLRVALTFPYAEGITLTPTRIVSGSSDRATIEFVLPSQKTVSLQAGTASEGIVVAYVGDRLIVLSDGNHWRVVPKPR